MVNDPFTHKSLADDEYARSLFKLIGYETYFVWTSEIVPEEGGDVEETLDRITGLTFFGEAPHRDSARKSHRRYGQPSRNATFRNFRAFGARF